MRHFYKNLLMALMAILLVTNYSFAQKEVVEGKIRIKFKPEQTQKVDVMHQKLKSAQLKSTAPVILEESGFEKIDALNQTFDAKAMRRVFRDAGKFEQRHREFGLHLWYEIEFESEAELNAILAEFGNVPEVQIAEPIHQAQIYGYKEDNQKALKSISGTNDPRFTDQWHYENTGQNGGNPGSDISLLDAWTIETGNSNVIVAIEDGGVDFDHEDLIGNMWNNPGEIPNNGVDDDNNGYVDDYYGYNFVNNSGTIVPHDHGTHVAGTVGAETNNGKGVAGVAGGSGNNDGVRLMSCQVFTSSSSGGFAEAYTYAADMGAVISQNSWGYTSAGVFDQAVQDGIDYFIANAGGAGQAMQGGIVIFAAGNDGTDKQWYPGYYSATLAVAATNNEDEKSYYSNYGTWVDISAPGGELISSNNDPTAIHSTLPNDSYGVMQGTSMACPHVSGVAALIVSQSYGNITPQEVWDKLVNNTDPIDNLNPSYAGKLGSGRMNAYASLNTTPPPAPDVPTNVQAVGVAASEFTITWDAAQYATNYDVQVRVQGGSWTTYNVSGTLKTVTAQPLTTYEFQVRANNSTGSSNYSSIVNVTTPAQSYCSSEGQDYSYEWIAEVQVGSFTKSSGASGYSNFTSETVTLNAGNSYNVSLTPGFSNSSYNEYWKIWIDFNSDSDFEDAGELVFDPGSMSSTTVNGQISIPAGIETTTRMRVTMKYNGAPTPCETFSYGEVEDYTVQITAGTINPPSVPTGLTSTNITTNSFTATWNSVSNATSYDVQIRPQGGSWSTYNTTATSYDYTGASPATTYEFKVRANNAGGSSAYSASAYVTTLDIVSYCSSGGNNASYEWIDLVRLGSIDNATGSNGGYADFTNLSTNLQRGVSTTIYISCGFQSSSYNEYWRIWIDLDQDGIFEDTELLVSGSSSSSGTLSASLDIPSSAVLGSTRMRVSMKWNAYATACETFSYGEVEDYTVNITDVPQATMFTETNSDGLEKTLPGSDMSVFPNPAHNQVQVKYTGKNDAIVEIRNLSGALVKVAQVSNESRTVSIEDLAPSTYIISINNGEKVTHFELIKY